MTSSHNFLFTTWEGGGNIGPVITVARKLLERGHRVRLMSDSACRSDAEVAGLSFRPWKNAPDRPDRSPESCPLRDWEASGPEDGIGRVLEKILFGPSLEHAKDVIEELDRESADAVVTSEMLPGVMAACESRRQPMAILAANLCLYPFPDMPAFGPGLPPPRGAEEIALHQQIRAGTAALFGSHLPSLNRTRQTLGLAPIEEILDQVCVADAYLLATARAFDFPVASPPAFLRYVGPQIDELSWVQDWKSPWSHEDRRPLVTVGFSTTYQAHEGVLQNVIDAAAEFPVRSLVTLGQVPEDKLRPAANTALVRSAPHDAVMRESSVVVTHGGHGTVMRALRHRRPMLIIPHGRDQQENAIRVTERGAGIKLSTAAGRNEIGSALDRLLHDPAFARAARVFGDAIEAESDDSRVVTELEQIAMKKIKCLHPFENTPHHMPL